MKPMMLTGLATEQSFETDGQSQFLLVFNNGEFRIPVPEETVQAVIQVMYGSSEDLAPKENVTPQANGNGHSYPLGATRTHSDYDTADEDGVDQI